MNKQTDAIVNDKVITNFTFLISMSKRGRWARPSISSLDMAFINSKNN